MDTIRIQPLPPDTFRVGDIISASGAGLPREYWGQKMRVTAVDARGYPTFQLLPRDEPRAALAERAQAALQRARQL